MTSETLAAIRLTHESLDWCHLNDQATTETTGKACGRIAAALAAVVRKRIGHIRGLAKDDPEYAADLPVLADLETLLGPGEAS